LLGGPRYAASGLSPEQALEPGAPRQVLDEGLIVGGRLRENLGLVLGRAHELLAAAPLGEALEIAANRGAHVVEVAFLSHRRSFPGRQLESF
jgi:hypothetical protein